MKKYKLTTQDLQTHNNFQWKLGVKEVIREPTDQLCSKGVFHFYNSPEEASLFNPIHANIQNPKLFEVEIDRVVAEDGLKGGCHHMTLVKEIPLPSFTPEQKVKFCILCALEVYKEESFLKWAKRWLSGEDRSADAAYAAYAAAYAAYAAARAAYAAAYAAYAAAAAAYAADAAAYAAAAADAAAYAAAADAAAHAAAYAADAYAKKRKGEKIDFKKIISMLA